MKKNSLLIFILFLLIPIGKSQTLDKKLAFGFSIGKNLYVGDYGGNGVIDFGHTEPRVSYTSYGLSLGLYISPAIELGIQANYGDYGYYNSKDFIVQNYKGVDSWFNSFLTVKYQATTSIKYKFHFLNDEDKFLPFLSVGMGVAGYARNTSRDKPINPDDGSVTAPRGDFKGTDLIIPFGFGVRYRLSGKTAIQYQYLYNLTNADNHDTHMSGSPGNANYDFEHQKAGNDAFGEHIFTITYSIDIDPTYDKVNVWRTTRYKGYKDDGWKTYRYRKD